MSVHNIGLGKSTNVRKADIFEELLSHILDGTLHPGERLPSERVLCLRFGVSRPVVREVLAGLAESGFVEVLPGKGSYVRPPAAHDLSRTMTHAAARTGTTPRHLVAARIALECASVELATSATANDIAEVEAALQRHESANSIEAQARTDVEFHEAITQASGNPVLVLMFGAISEYVYELTLRSHSDNRVHELGDPLHRKIMTAIRDRDAVAAVAAMKKHLSLALELYGDDLDKPLPDIVASRGLSRVR